MRSVCIYRSLVRGPGTTNARAGARSHPCNPPTKKE
nr:KpnI [Aspergillus nidulans]